MSRQDLNKLLADIEKDPSEWSKGPGAWIDAQWFGRRSTGQPKRTTTKQG